MSNPYRMPPPPQAPPKLTMLEALRKRASTLIQQRYDSWRNDVTGFGTDRDKTTYGYVEAFIPLSDQVIAALVHTDDMAERMVSIVPQEMLREGFAVETTDEVLDTVIAEKCEQLNLREKLVEGIRWGRAFGGAGLLLGADDGQDASEPLDIDAADDLSYVHVIDKRLLWPVEFYTDPKHPKFGRPKIYNVTTTSVQATSTSFVHESRLVIFGGAPTGIRERTQLYGWDMSVLQRPFEILRSFNTGWKATEVLLTDSNQTVLKMSGLANMMGAPDGEELLQRRARAMDMYRSVMRALVIDAEGGEAIERSTVSFADVPAILDKFMLRLAAAVQIPVTILMGQSPAGMNATGDSDFRWFYDRIRAEQNLMLAPRIRRIINVWLKSRAGRKLLKGKDVPTLQIKFPSLWGNTPVEEAQRRQAIATQDAAYVQAGVLTPDEIALARFRPEGFDQDLVLDAESRKARESGLKHDLEQIAAGQPTENEAAQGGGGAPAMGGAPKPAMPKPAPAPAEKTFAQEISEEIDRAQAAEAHRRAVRVMLHGGRGEPELKLDTKARVFDLVRDEDETGVSGTGTVGEGVEFENGVCVLRWKTATSSTTIFNSMKELLKVHGHGGKTRVVYTDGQERLDALLERETTQPKGQFAQVARAIMSALVDDGMPEEDSGESAQGKLSRAHRFVSSSIDDGMTFKGGDNDDEPDFDALFNEAD